MNTLELELTKIGDALEAAAGRDLSSRLGPTRRRRTLALAAAVVAVLGAVGGGVAATVLSGPSHFEHGKLVLPPQLATEMGRLNTALDACYLANGATRVDLGDGAFTYSDPDGTAQRACQRQQAAVNAFADGPQMRAAADAAAPLLRAYWTCMRSSGALPEDPMQAAAVLHTTAFRTTEESCSAKANAAAGSGQ
jgi:hypothetical protein